MASLEPLHAVSATLPSQLRIHHAIQEIPQDAWDALLPPGAAFLEWAWLDALESSGSVAPDRGWHPHHLAVWQGNRLVAAAPAYLKDDSHGEFVFDWSWATAAERLGVPYYPKLVLAVPLTPAAGSRILVAPGEDAAARRLELLAGALDAGRSMGLSSVHVLFPQEDEVPALEEAGFASRLGVQYHWLNPGYRSFDDFLGRFQSKRRNRIQRERRAVAQQGIELSTRSGAALAQVDPDEVYRLYCSTVDKYFWGGRHLTADFFARVLKSPRPRMELVEARKAGRLVAGAVNFATDLALYGRYWGTFEEHPFLHFNVCQYYPVEDCIRRGLLRFEPGAGGEHKLVRGFEPRLTYSAHFLFHPILDRAVRNFLAAERKAIREGMAQLRAETGFRD